MALQQHLAKHEKLSTELGSAVSDRNTHHQRITELLAARSKKLQKQLEEEQRHGEEEVEELEALLEGSNSQLAALKEAVAKQAEELAVIYEKALSSDQLTDVLKVTRAAVDSTTSSTTADSEPVSGKPEPPSEAATPRVEEPSAEVPAAVEPGTEGPEAEEPTKDAPKAEEPTTEAPKAEGPSTEAPKAEETTTDAPKAEQPAPGVPGIVPPPKSDLKTVEV